MNGITIVIKKELMDLFRDRKTLIVGILIPLLIFPLIFGLMGRSVEKSTKSVTENMKIAIVDNGNSALGQFIKTQQSVKIVESKDIKKDVQEGNIYAGVVIPAGFDDAIKSEEAGEVSIIFDDSSQSSGMAQATIQGIIQSYSQTVVASRLSAKGIDISVLNPVVVSSDTVSKEENGFAKYMMSLMLPLLLVMYAVSSPMAAAIDLGAGEKERGTLEPLLTTQASRMNLLFGKLVSVTAMGVIGITASIIGLFISMKISPGVFGGGEGATGGIGLSPTALLLMGLVTVLLTVVFGALELSISIYARSFKEAQTYVTPLTIVGMAAAYGTYMMEVKNISSMLFNIPIVNVSLIIKELIAGMYNMNHLLITFSWNLIYVVAAILFARYMFSRESVIFRT